MTHSALTVCASKRMASIFHFGIGLRFKQGLFPDLFFESNMSDLLHVSVKNRPDRRRRRRCRPSGNCVHVSCALTKVTHSWKEAKAIMAQQYQK